MKRNRRASRLGAAIALGLVASSVAACDPATLALASGVVLTGRALYCDGVAEEAKQKIRDDVSDGLPLLNCGGAK